MSLRRKPAPKPAASDELKTLNSNGHARPPYAVAAAKANVPPLSPTQRHYLLKVLVCAEMHDEWSLLDEHNGLQQYGAPFLTSGGRAPASVGRHAVRHREHTAAPVILLHLFHTYLRRFPGLDAAKPKYWRTNIVPFFARLSDAHLSTSAERSQLTNRKMLNITATRYFSTFFARGVGVRGVGEQRGPGKGELGSEVWGHGKRWGRGTVKRGLDAPLRMDANDVAAVDKLFDVRNDTDDDNAVRLWQAGAANTERVKGDWSAWKESIIESEAGLDETLLLLQTKFMKNLPDPYRNAAEWVRRHVAFVAWTVLVQYPGGDEIFAIIKTIHTLFPYWGAKQLLKIINAEKMIKAIIDMVLARPLGAIDSLGQRIFFLIMRGEIDTINRGLLTPLRKAIDDAAACKALDEYAATRTTEQRNTLLERAQADGCDVLTLVLDKYGYGRPDHVRAWQDAYATSVFLTNVDWAYPDSCLEAKHIKIDAAVRRAIAQATPAALKFAQLKLYLREALRRRDRKEVLAIGSGPLVPTLIRQSLEIVFYKLFYEIALASDLSSRLQDLQNFVDDLIRVKTQKKDTLEDYIALAARHEDSLYFFVHEIRDAVKPVFDWCQAALDFMALSTTEPWNPSNNKAPRIELDLDELLRKASASVDVQAVLAEVAAVEQYTKWDKIRTEVAMRKEYALIHDDAVTNVTLCSWSRGGLQRGLHTGDTRLQPTSSTKNRLHDLDGLMLTLLNNAGVTPDEGLVHDGVRGTDAAEVPWGFFTPNDVLMQRYADPIRAAAQPRTTPRSYHIDGVHVPPPTVAHIRTLLPAFRTALSGCLPDWTSQATDTPPRKV